MKVEVGYITAWRRAIFFTFIISIVIFGTVSSIASSVLNGLAGKLLILIAILLCIVLFILVISDKWDKYTGIGIGEIKDGVLIYEDRKRHFKIKLDDIKKVDIEKIKWGENIKGVLAYRILIKTDKKKYYIESERAGGREYDEVELHKLYLYIMENMG